MKHWLCVAAILILLAGCTGGGQPAQKAPAPAGPAPAGPAAQPVAQPAAKPVEPVQGDCPAGLFQVGGEPPQAFEKWCHHKTPDGTFVKEGPYKKWYKDGKPEATGEYANNVQSGRWEEFGQTGNKSEGAYAKGKRAGKWTVRHEDGMREVGEFKDGERVGVWTAYWDEKDVRKEAGSFVGGKRDGVWSYYDQNNLKTGEAVYKAGELVSTKQVKREDKPAKEEAAGTAAAPKKEATGQKKAAPEAATPAPEGKK